MEGHQPKAEEGFDPEKVIPPPSGTGVRLSPETEAQPKMPAHQVVELGAAAALELENIVTHKTLAQLKIKVALRDMQDAQKEEVLYQRQEAILVARAAAAAGIESFQGAKVIGQGKIAFVL